MGLASLGLDIVRCCRNSFAHGALHFPEPEKWSGASESDWHLIRLSSRLLLMSVQSLLAVEYSGQFMPSEQKEYETVEIAAALREVHLRTDVYSDPHLF